MRLKKAAKRAYYSFLQKVNASSIELELSKIRVSPRFETGTTNLFRKPFKYHDGASFEATYRELFQTHIYNFSPSKIKKVILDCGANMGLSVLYFSENFPDHHIIAFEPDERIFKILKENVEVFGLKNVTLHQKAVWNKWETLEFFTDGGMGGRVENSYANQTPVKVDAVPLREFLNDDVDFLKIDIEGAEGLVLKDCEDILYKANNIFFEYHNYKNSPQNLHELLQLVSSKGFTYYIKESDIRKRPFTEEHIIGESFNMALNIFCYKS